MKLLRIFAFAGSLLAMSAPAAMASKPSALMVTKFNKVRAAHGLKPLREAPKLDRSAASFARRLIRTDSWAHGTSFTLTGFRVTGEILAFQRGARDRPGSTLRQWLNSPDHARMILNPSFTYVGTGPARGTFQGQRTTIWVAHFGAN